jgi:Transglutaminase-like superfamily/Coenzyme PQQ synthesis protein D (PqqD)
MKKIPHQPAHFIRQCTLEGLVVVLDLRVSQYLIFDEVASCMWTVLLSIPDRSQRVDEIVSRFNVPRSKCEHDMDEFLKSCEKRGLLCQGAAELPKAAGCRVPYRSPNVLNAWKSLYATRRSLAISGFSETYHLHLRITTPETSNGRRVGSLSAAIRAFNRAENLFSVRDAPNDCLPRSLALHRYLLSAGFDADHCIGVRRFPFGAHAWVEVARTVVCDSESFVGQFTEIARA